MDEQSVESGAWSTGRDSTSGIKREDLLCDDLPTIPCPECGGILVSGASGYIGGRLITELMARGYNVRAMVRADPHIYRDRFPGADIVAADALRPESLPSVFRQIHTAYYLIHSLMLGGKHFSDADREAAYHFRMAAEKAGVRRILYLGALGDTTGDLSSHLRSRMDVARELQKGTIPVTTLRAAIIIGSGSASYEIISHLVGKTRFLLLPPWAQTRCQPIGIRDVIKYLVGILETPETTGKTYDIGGPEILTYEQILRIKAQLMGRKILFCHTSFSNTAIYAYLASLLTPVPAPIVHSLMEGLRNEVVCQDTAIQEKISFPLVSYKETLLRALSREEQDKIATRWSDAYPPAHELSMKLHELSEPPTYKAVSTLVSGKSDAALFQSICRIGGKGGWFHGNWLWRTRGMIDRLLMGIGTMRGRRSDHNLRENDVIDFWRVERLEVNRTLRLRAEMKLPGKAWLEFRIQPLEEGRNRLSVEAFFYTNTLFGKAYWYCFYPFHFYIFNDLIKGIEKRSC